MELKELTDQLSQLVADQKTFHAKAEEEFKANGQSNASTLEQLAAVKKQIADVQAQTDAIDRKMTEGRFMGESEEKGPGDLFIESEEFKASRAADYVELRSKDGRLRKAIPSLFSRKATITTTSGITAGSTGITMPLRLPGIQITAQQELRIRDLMNVRQMNTGNAFDYVRQITRTNAASPVIETSPKAESTYAWDSVSDTVKTIAHWVNVSRQALDDVPWLRNMLNSELLYGLKVKEESEILSGDGLGQHINGLIKQATAYSTSYNVGSDTKIDTVRHAKLQARLAGLATFAPDGIVLNPTDMHAMELIKTEEGGANKGLYIIGNPTTGPAVKTLWGLPVVESDSIAVGKFLVGAFGTAAEIVDRMAAMIEISYENGNNFVNNVVTLLCEERIGLAVFRPGAFIYGTFPS